MEYKLSICIPARNEEWLKNTIEDILKNREDNTEIIVGLDGEWANPQISQHPDVQVIYVPESIGQRAILDLCVRFSKAKYIIKCDAHCSFDKGFDRKMIEFMQKWGDDVTAIPVMKNLHVFDWACKDCDWIRYQGPTPVRCENKACGGPNFYKKMIWEPRANVNNGSFCFDSEPHFQYFGEFKHRPEYVKNKRRHGFTESMSLQGSFFMCTREKFWELKLGNGNLGNWGNQGLQVACATWLSGGRVLCNHHTWYSHCFRTQGGDFAFPYPQPGQDIRNTKRNVWEMIKNNKLPKQIHPVSWLIRKFSPVPGWTEEKIAELK